MGKKGRGSGDAAARARGASAASTDWRNGVQSIGDLTPEKVSAAYGVTRIPCTKKAHKKNCVDNVHCLWGLGEYPDQTAEYLLGRDPGEKSKKAGGFVGLKNLGATCYMSTLIQSLFMNSAFRSGVYKWQPDESRAVEHDACAALQHLFARLQRSPTQSIDPSDFTKSEIQLQTNIQQDPQEFFKLFMSLLEERLTQSPDPTVQTLIQDLFQGKLRYETTCRKCGRVSSSSTTFQELELPVKGVATLEDAVKEYTKQEELTGTNQYFCEACACKVDAGRRVVITDLPQILNVQLMRFVFDPAKGTKQKLRSRMRFPFTLDMKDYVAVEKPQCTQFRLSAVLIHKGTSAYGGHYIANIRDELSDVEKPDWWEFDDEVVRKQTDLTNALNDADAGDGDDPEGKGKSKGKAKKTSSIPGTVTNTNAYMLIYSRVDRELREPVACPPTLAAMVDAEAAAFRADVEQFSERYQATKRRREEHEVVYDTIMKHVVPAPGEPFYWIDAEWFRSWVEHGFHPLPPDADAGFSLHLPPINNEPLLCQHRKVDPGNLHRRKVVTEYVWDKLYEKYPGQYVLRSDDERVYPCVDCLMDAADAFNTEQDLDSDKKEALTILDQFKPGDMDPSRCFYVSRSWVTDFRRARGAKQVQLRPPLVDITCGHGNLTTDEKARRVVPPATWRMFKARFNVPDNQGFPATADACPICEVEETQSNEEQDCIRQRNDEQKRRLQQFYNSVPPLPEPTSWVSLAPAITPLWPENAVKRRQRLWVLSGGWGRQWRRWVDGISPEELPPADNADIACPHRWFKYDPRPLLAENRQLEPPHAEPKMMLVSENSWQTLRELGHLAPEITNLWLDWSDDSGAYEPCPGICDGCLAAQAEADHHARLNYADKSIYILVKKRDDMNEFFTVTSNGRRSKRPESFGSVVTQAATPTSGTRARSTRSSKGHPQTIGGVSSTQTLHTLKLKIYQATDIAPFQQALSFESGGPLDVPDDQLPLSACNIYPGITLIVEKRPDARSHDDDVARSREPEQGFKGTGLTGRFQPATASNAPAGDTAPGSPSLIISLTEATDDEISDTAAPAGPESMDVDETTPQPRTPPPPLSTPPLSPRPASPSPRPASPPPTLVRHEAVRSWLPQTPPPLASGIANGSPVVSSSSSLPGAPELLMSRTLSEMRLGDVGADPQTASDAQVALLSPAGGGNRTKLQKSESPGAVVDIDIENDDDDDDSAAFAARSPRASASSASDAVGEVAVVLSPSEDEPAALSVDCSPERPASSATPQRRRGRPRGSGKKANGSAGKGRGGPVFSVDDDDPSTADARATAAPTVLSDDLHSPNPRTPPIDVDGVSSGDDLRQQLQQQADAEIAYKMQWEDLATPPQANGLAKHELDDDVTDGDPVFSDKGDADDEDYEAKATRVTGRRKTSGRTTKAAASGFEATGHLDLVRCPTCRMENAVDNIVCCGCDAWLDGTATRQSSRKRRGEKRKKS